MNKQRQQQNLSQSRDGGYTIIESLVAMIVVSVLMIAIAPVMAFSVATRVQARRTELATQAARAYIDALRTGAIKPTDTAFPGTATGAPGSVSNLYCVEFDGKSGCTGSTDFRIQGVRVSNDVTTTTPEQAQTAGYRLNVRVYRGDASGTLTPTAQSIVGAGLGDPKAPVTVMQTEIPPSTVTGSYGSLCSRIGANGCK
ncbi:MAG: type II secretion system protein [Microcoleus sp. PH2017_25_DOB_D_A]|uniref:prepilin-type N-terminal cleavage/methylation domain-containing protein n=1 Tax=unclassified Microcoleus TaxID=2642155 RepID=UPI001DC887A4|nr:MULTISPECIES: prepilin-type N-terminal cleavage/methylation domain-containing protein [unclassified Microcoleus]TAE39974.1 MAG: type II secretion system protein [Oscillatoriales cyanobacterium]MCC3494433.1 type II secretion system protein [Microcoleus sp. PH2017_16_JOR_D_A]MCC3519433.1 type II secretion system protein [Microcoleus sp. PH2017_18_LLB_O_A]MCC3538180.1 type II secretion system protein [Microcoleus sp. PH2017_25_DOB_D_A]MCC3550095.1 type II secretion system protein [Microcoleus 